MSPASPHSEHVGTILAANHRAFLDFLERRTGSRAEAEDILQSALLRGLERGETVRNDEKTVAWFYRVLRNALVDAHRAKDARRRAMAKLEETSEGPDSALEAVVCRCFEALLPTLNADYATILRRVDLGGTDLATFAEQAGLTPNNARVRLHRARRALRKQLQNVCATCAVHGCLDCTCDVDVHEPAATCNASAPHPSAGMEEDHDH